MRKMLPILSADYKGRILFFSRSCEILTGFKRDKIIGRKVDEIIECKNLVEKLTTGKSRDKIDLYILRKNGGKKLIRWSWFEIQDRGDQGGEICFIGEEVLDQFSSEETSGFEKTRQYSTYVVGKNTAVVKKGVFIHADKGFLERLGVDEEDIINKSFIDFVSPNSLPILRAFFVDRLRGENMGSCDVKLLARDGDEVHAKIYQKILGKEIVDIVKILAK